MVHMWHLILFSTGLVLQAAAIKWLPLDRAWVRLGLIGFNALVWLSAVLVWSWLVLPASVALINVLRLSQHRYGPKRERRVLLRTSGWLSALCVITALWLAFVAAAWRLGWDTLAGLSLAAVASRALVLVLYRGLKHQFRPQAIPPVGTLPALTLAVPARNETHALTDHLRAVVAGRYDKLEVIVLDDCSQDSTPDIVRSFANDGVRFIQGRQPAASWLGKNFAYQTLLEEASGDWIMFAGVDIRLEPTSLARLVALAERTQSDVVSVMPYRRNFDWLPTLLRPLRYFWQLGFSAWPLMNSCWLVRREWLLAQGGFRPHKHSIWPERMLATIARASDNYQFVISTPELGVTTRKRAGSVLETAKRTLYPLQKRELVWLMAKSLVLLSWLALPWLELISLPASLLLAYGWLLLWLAYAVSEMLTQPRVWYLSAWSLPLNLLNEIWLGLVSAYGYEFGRVNWKGRSICLPVLAQDSRER